jgi:hypothetical protein
MAKHCRNAKKQPASILERWPYWITVPLVLVVMGAISVGLSMLVGGGFWGAFLIWSILIFILRKLPDMLGEPEDEHDEPLFEQDNGDAR